MSLQDLDFKLKIMAKYCTSMQHGLDARGSSRDDVVGLSPGSQDQSCSLNFGGLIYDRSEDITKTHSNSKDLKASKETGSGGRGASFSAE